MVLFAGSCCLFGCSEGEGPEEGSYEDMVEKYSGTYRLSKVLWSGTPLDLDNDGTSRWDLLDGEFGTLPGFYEPDLSATISASLHEGYGSRPSLAVNVKLPYPDYQQEGEGYAVSRLSLLPVSIHEIYAGNSRLSCETLYFKLKETVRDFLSGLEEITVTEISPEKFVVRLYCSMYDSRQQKYQKNYLRYTFVR